MKLYNQIILDDIKELDDVDLIGEIANQPTHQNIHVRWSRNKKPQIEWADERPGHRGPSSGRIKGIEGYIQKNIGKPFGEVYSNFLHNSKHCMYKNYGWGGATPRQDFLEFFELPRYRWLDNDYGLDENYTIVDLRKQKKANHQGRYTYVGVETYWRVSEYRICRAASQIQMAFGSAAYSKLIEWTDSDLSAEQIEWFRNHYLGPLNNQILGDIWNTNKDFRSHWMFNGLDVQIRQRILDFIFNKHQKTVRTFHPYGSPTYWEIVNQEKLDKRARAKEKRNPDRTIYDIRLKYDKLLRKKRTTMTFDQFINNNYIVEQ